MTLDAQRHTVAGAILTSRKFREALSKCNNVEDVAEALRKYADKNGVGDFDSAVIPDVWKFISVRGILGDLKDCIELFCRQWPCG